MEGLLELEEDPYSIPSGIIHSSKHRQWWGQKCWGLITWHMHGRGGIWIPGASSCGCKHDIVFLHKTVTVVPIIHSFNKLIVHLNSWGFTSAHITEFLLSCWWNTPGVKYRCVDMWASISLLCTLFAHLNVFITKIRKSKYKMRLVYY